MAIRRDSIWAECPNCKQNDKYGFEEKIVLHLIPVENPSKQNMEVTERRRCIVCRKCSHIIRDLRD